MYTCPHRETLEKIIKEAIQEPGIVAYSCILSTQGAEAGESKLWGQSVIPSKTLLKQNQQ
ncbi:mCG147111 [Mus musculus]|jgi:hypothetical protein|nr:mCG147111 [Mus musculus]